MVPKTGRKRVVEPTTVMEMAPWAVTSPTRNVERNDAIDGSASKRYLSASLASKLSLLNLESAREGNRLAQVAVVEDADDEVDEVEPGPSLWFASDRRASGGWPPRWPLFKDNGVPQGMRKSEGESDPMAEMTDGILRATVERAFQTNPESSMEQVEDKSSSSSLSIVPYQPPLLDQLNAALNRGRDLSLLEFSFGGSFTREQLFTGFNEAVDPRKLAIIPYKDPETMHRPPNSDDMELT